MSGLGTALGRWLGRVQFLVDQYRPVPSPEQAASVWRDSYGGAEQLSNFEKLALVGLYESETQVFDDGHFRAGSELLDIGCGAGREAVGFADRGMRVTAVDATPGMVARAEQIAGGRGIRFEVGSLTSLHYPRASFDAAYISSDVYQKTPGRSMRVAALESLRRIVRPGGSIVFAATVSTNPSTRVRWLVEEPRAVLRRWIPRHIAARGDAFYRPASGGPPRYHHVFDSDSEVEDEILDAGLVPVAIVETLFVAHTPGGADRYRPSSRVSVAPISEGLLIADMGAGVSYRTNRSGAALWAHFAKGSTLDEAATAVASELHAPVERVTDDAETMLATLVKQRLIERVAVPR